MIDYVKGYFDVNYKHEIDSFLLDNCDRYDLIRTYNCSTSEIYVPFRGRLHNLEIVSTKIRPTFIQNSLHSFFNALTIGEAKNYDDFHYENLKSVLKYLENEFGTELFNKIYPTQLEFGFNIDFFMDASVFIDKKILMYKNKLPTYSKSNSKMCIKKFIHEDFELKVYDKGKESKLKQSNLIRIEIKYTGANVLNKFGIYTLMDLSKKSVLESIFSDFIKRVNDLFIINCVACNLEELGLTEKEQLLISQYSNPNYWADLTKTEKEKQLKTWRALEKKHNLNSYKKILIELISEKFKNLLNN